MSDDQGYFGNLEPEDTSNDFNAHSFLIRSILSKISTATLVQVVKCTNAGGVSSAGFVDVRPMVNQIDGNGNAIAHGVIYRCPYFRLQGGANAVILDPQPGDIGIAIFADRDISSATANKRPSNPGSRRRFDMSDALYIGGVINGTPSQFIEFSGAGITLTSPTKVIVNAPEVDMNTAVLKVSGDIVDNYATNPHNMGAMRTIYNTHTHGGIQPGSGSTGVPSVLE